MGHITNNKELVRDAKELKVGGMKVVMKITKTCLNEISEPSNRSLGHAGTFSGTCAILLVVKPIIF